MPSERSSIQRGRYARALPRWKTAPPSGKEERRWRLDPDRSPLGRGLPRPPLDEVQEGGPAISGRFVRCARARDRRPIVVLQRRERRHGWLRAERTHHRASAPHGLRVLGHGAGQAPPPPRLAPPPDR